MNFKACHIWCSIKEERYILTKDFYDMDPGSMLKVPTRRKQNISSLTSEQLWDSGNDFSLAFLCDYL